MNRLVLLTLFAGCAPMQATSTVPPPAPPPPPAPVAAPAPAPTQASAPFDTGRGFDVVSTSNCAAVPKQLEYLSKESRFLIQGCDLTLFHPHLDDLEIQSATVLIEGGTLVGRVSAVTGSHVTLRNVVVSAMLVSDVAGTYIDGGGNTFLDRVSHQPLGAMKECSPGVTC